MDASDQILKFEQVLPLFFCFLLKDSSVRRFFCFFCPTVFMVLLKKFKIH